MSRVKIIKLLGLVLAIVLIIVGVLPVFRGNVLTNDDITTSIIPKIQRIPPDFRFSPGSFSLSTANIQ